MTQQGSGKPVVIMRGFPQIMCSIQHYASSTRLETVRNDVTSSLKIKNSEYSQMEGRTHLQKTLSNPDGLRAETKADTLRAERLARVAD